MSRYYHRRRFGYRRHPSSPGEQRAIEHVRAYADLERRLGPIVDDVRQAFLSLPSSSLDTLFREYGHQYGPSAQSYAIDAFPHWKDGTRRMSGQTASRLLNLVPKHLSRQQRLAMVKRLCEHHSQRHHESIEIDREHPEQTLQTVREAIDRIADFSVVKSLPEHVTTTVTWLNDNDVVVGRAMLTEVDKEMHIAVRNSIERNWNMIATIVRKPDVDNFSERFVFPTGTIDVYARKQSRCFIATAVYQDPNHPDVRRLRVWREQQLRPHFWGRLLIHAYGWIGPLGAISIRCIPCVRPHMRRGFAYLVRLVERSCP